MINRAHRFHRRNAINLVYRRGKVVRVGGMALKYWHNSRQESYRTAVVVSRKVHKSAVARNRIRRRIYESVRAYEPQMAGPCDLIFIVYSDEFAIMDFTRLQKTIRDLLKKSGMVA